MFFVIILFFALTVLHFFIRCCKFEVVLMHTVLFCFGGISIVATCCGWVIFTWG